MILIDSSVWINHWRNNETRSVRQLRAPSGREEMLFGDLVLLEVLQGERDERHAEQIEGWLRPFRLVPLLDRSIAVRAAANFRALRACGIAIRKTVDLIIGTFCIENDYALLADDRDFAPMATHLGLRLA